VWDPRHERLEDYTDARLTGLVRTAAGVADLPVRVVAKGAFSFAAQVADRYRRGRAFLVGDAAQRMTPRGGMGMNTAVAEGHDLAWKLAWELRGWAGPALLDTYEAEWRPVGARRAARSADPGPEPSGAEALAEDLNGRLAHAWLPGTDGHPRSTPDLLGPGLTLLTGPTPGPWAEATATFDLRVPLELHSLDWATARLLGIHPDGALLSRPDAQPLATWPAAPPDPTAALASALPAWSDRREVPIGCHPRQRPGPEDLQQEAEILGGHPRLAKDQSERPDDLTAGGGRELGHAEMRTSMDASSGFASTSGTGLSSK
jgi:putative polyketide hydroxylase